MDYDDFQSDQSPEPDRHGHDLLDDDNEDGNWRARERSQTPVHGGDASGSKAKPRKRLIKKSQHAGKDAAPEFADEDEEDDIGGFVRDGSDGKRKKLSGGSGKKEKRPKGDKYGGKGGGSSSRLSKRGFADKAARDQDGEVKEMWDTIAGGDSEVFVFIFCEFIICWCRCCFGS